MMIMGFPELLLYTRYCRRRCGKVAFRGWRPRPRRWGRRPARESDCHARPHVLSSFQAAPPPAGLPWIQVVAGQCVKLLKKPLFGCKYVLSTRERLGTEVLSSPCLKGDLGGLSAGYLIRTAPWRKGGMILSQVNLPGFSENEANTWLRHSFRSHAWSRHDRSYPGIVNDARDPQR
jgi:hypothetical protein